MKQIVCHLECMTISPLSPVDRAFEEFCSARRFPALDGLRALSIVMVLTSHMHDPLWFGFSGGLGVTIFFGISGFLITTLLLREKDRTGSVSLSRFYTRRVFRIVPLYALALLITSVLVLGFGLGEGGAGFLDRLPLLATFNGEFAGSGTFSHSWSLGIEEKFYIIWPLLAFFVPWVRNHLLQALLVLFPLTMIASFTPGVGYLGIYATIVGGCLLAVLMNSPKPFRMVANLAHPVVATVLFAVMFAYAFGAERVLPLQDESKYAHAVFGLLVLLALPGLTTGSGPLMRFFSLGPIVFYGQHAYGIYLFHPFVIEVVDRVVGAGQESAVVAIARFLAVFVLSFGVAVVLKRRFEDPLIRLGRRLTSSELPLGSIPSDALEAHQSNSQPAAKGLE